MKLMIQYFSERFPLQLVLVLSFGYSLMLLGLIGKNNNIVIDISTVLLVTLSFSAFLLRLRVTDEFKDAKHDKKYFPNRPFQRGSITKNQLIKLGLASFIIEIGAIYFTDPMAVVYYLPVVIYSAFTAKEFFMSAWLDKHFNIYLLTHQLIFVFFYIWALLTFGAKLNLMALYGAVSFTTTMLIFEIVRKIEYRYDKKGKVVKDSYPAVWSMEGTISLLIFFTLLVGLLLTVVTNNEYHLVLSTLSILFTYTNKPKLIQTVIGLNMLSQGVLLFL